MLEWSAAASFVMIGRNHSAYARGFFNLGK